MKIKSLIMANNLRYYFYRIWSARLINNSSATFGPENFKLIESMEDTGLALAICVTKKALQSKQAPVLFY